ncbi:MAG TPA: non-homologous end-joining DNA ligase [Syntrophomonadaceae bacterium]|nr:non-homologous end-joining DNA ligase [Syntrophomonadaceae bacterium]
MSTISSEAVLDLNGHRIELSHLDKMFWTREGYHKADLINYYAKVAPILLKHLQDRPLVWTRYPDGIEKKSFYQKNAPPYLPDWVDTFTYHSQDSGRALNFILVQEAATLVWLANQAALEMHPWLSRVESPDRPDYVVFDLDPSPDNEFAQVVEVAWMVKRVLDELGLRSYLKTSGADGLHIFVPINNLYDYSQIRAFAQPVAALVCKLLPHLATIERKVDKRGALIYVDFLQNARGQTLCAPYSLRPRPGAPASCPLHWDELNDIHPSQFNLKTLPPRVQGLGDLFALVQEDKQDLSQAMQQLGMAEKGFV